MAYQDYMQMKKIYLAIISLLDLIVALIINNLSYSFIIVYKINRLV